MSPVAWCISLTLGNATLLSRQLRILARLLMKREHLGAGGAIAFEELLKLKFYESGIPRLQQVPTNGNDRGGIGRR